MRIEYRLAYASVEEKLKAIFACSQLAARVAPGLLAAVILACAHPAVVQADDAATLVAPDALDEIVVTANKRAESIWKVPISVQAFSREALQESGVKSINDLASLTPGVEFDVSGSYAPGTLTNVAIRGINSGIGASPVGIYIDDTPIQSRISAASYWGNPFPVMFDVDRVEVERGPQGTLFGAGAEGGALRFISPEPNLSVGSGFTRAEVASTRSGGLSYEGGAAYGGPIVNDELGFRVSAWYRRDGGYIDRVDPFTGATVQENANRTDSYAVRAALAFAPAPWIKITPSVYAQKVHNDDTPSYFEYLSNPQQGDFRNGRLLQQPNTDQFVLPSLKLTLSLGSVELTSISSYFDRSAHTLDDQTSFDGAALGAYLSYGNPLGPEYPMSYADIGPAYAHTELHQFSQEIRLSSNMPDNPLRWTAGLWFSDTTQLDVLDVRDNFYAVNLFGLAPDSTLFLQTLQSKDLQVAAFGQADYKITDKLTLTLGVRVARTDSKFTETQVGPIADPLYPVASGDQKETPVTPKVGVSYQFDDSNMLYVSAGKGYRVGGANPPIPIQSAALPIGCPLPSEPAPYKSDSVWSYELGAKNRLFDGRLSVATSVYHIDWTNIQQNIYMAECGFGYIANTGKATINGFDFNAQAAVTNALVLGTSVGYTKTRIDADVYTLGQLMIKTGDVIGNPSQVNSPWDLTGFAKYNFHVAAGHEAYVRLEDVYHSRNPGPFSSRIATSPVYAPLLPPNPPTNVMNLRTGVFVSGVEFSAFVNNVADRRPALGRTQDTAASTLFTDVTFRPRTIGLTLEYKF